MQTLDEAFDVILQKLNSDLNKTKVVDFTRKVRMDLMKSRTVTFQSVPEVMENHKYQYHELSDFQDP